MLNMNELLSAHLLAVTCSDRGFRLAAITGSASVTDNIWRRLCAQDGGSSRKVKGLSQVQTTTVKGMLALSHFHQISKRLIISCSAVVNALNVSTVPVQT